MEDLFRALGMFQDGMQKYAVTKGIQSATQQVEQINASDMDALQKRQQQSQLANKLAMQLTQAGASGQQIQTAVGAVAPPQIKDAQDAYMLGLQNNDPGLIDMATKAQKYQADAAAAPGMIQQNDQQEFIGAQNEKERLKDLAVAGMAAGRGMQKSDRQFLSGFQTKYSAAVKDWNKQKQPLMNAVSLIDSNSKMGVSAMGIMFARGSGNTGALTDKEQDVWKGLQSLLGKVQRYGLSAATSEMTAADKKELKKVAQWYRKNGELIIDDISDLYVNQAAQGVPDRPLDEVGDFVTGGRWSKKRTQSASQAAPQPAGQAPAAPSATGASGGWGSNQTPAAPANKYNAYWGK